MKIALTPYWAWRIRVLIVGLLLLVASTGIQAMGIAGGIILGIAVEGVIAALTTRIRG